MLDGYRPFIVADIGSNHRGNLELAKRSIEVAKQCAVDAVKFQMYTHEDIYSFPGEVKYPFDPAWLPILSEYCDSVDIAFMCTAFSAEGVKRVDPYAFCHKIASSEMIDVEILDAVIATGKPFIVSTGGAHFMELDWLVGHVKTQQPHAADRMAIMECVALYPAKPEHYNLSVIGEYSSGGDYSSVGRYIRGVSDHTLTKTVAVAAVGRGATIFEKHFDAIVPDASEPYTMGYDPTPDEPVSIGPSALHDYVKSIHEAYSALGDGVKRPAHQHEMALKWRRRLIATKDLKPGDVLRRGENYGSYRSLKDDTRAAAPYRWQELEGKTMKVELKAGDGVWVTDIC